MIAVTVLTFQKSTADYGYLATTRGLRTASPRHLMDLVDLLDVGPAAAAAAARHTAGHATRHAAWHTAHAAAAARRVHGRHDRRADALDLLALVLELLLLSHLVALQPAKRLVDSLCGLLLVVRRDLVLDLVVVEGRLHRIAIVLERVFASTFSLKAASSAAYFS